MHNHGVTAKSDPEFKPDPDSHHVWDEKKQVFRLVKKTKKNRAKKR